MNTGKRNIYSSVLFYMGMGLAVLGVIGSLILEDVVEGFLLIGIVSTAFTASLILGFAEVINILDESREHLRMMTQPKGIIEEINNNSTTIEDLPSL